MVGSPIAQKGASKFRHRRAITNTEEDVSEKTVDEVRQGVTDVSASPSGRPDDIRRIVRILLPARETDAGSSTLPASVTVSSPSAAVTTNIPSTEDRASSTMDAQTSSTESSSTSEMSITFTPTASLASTDKSTTPPPSTSATSTTTSTTISSPVSDSTGSTLSQATLTSSNTITTPSATSAATTTPPDSSSTKSGSPLPPPSSGVTISTVTISSYSKTSSSVVETASSSQTSVTPAATSSSTESTSQTSASDLSTVDPSQTEVSIPSDNVSSDSSTSSVGTTSTPSLTITAIPETKPTSTSVSSGFNGGTALPTTSTNSTSTDQTSTPSRTEQGPSESKNTTPTSSSQKHNRFEANSPVTSLQSISSQIPKSDSIVGVQAAVTSTSTTNASPNAGGQTVTNSRPSRESVTGSPQLTDSVSHSGLLGSITQTQAEITTLIAPSSSASSGRKTHTADFPDTSQPTSPASTPPPQTTTQGPTGVQTATPSPSPSPSPPPGQGNNGDSSSPGEGPLSQHPGDTNSHSRTPTAVVPGSSSTPAASSKGKPDDGPAPGLSANTPKPTPNPTEVPESKGTTLNKTSIPTDQPLPASTSKGGPTTTQNNTETTDQHGYVSNGVTPPSSASSHSEPKDAGGPGSPTHVTIASTTVSDHHTSNSATAEGDTEPTLKSLLVHSSGEIELSTYTTTFTSLKTFFELTTMTTTPPPTTMTTSTPYSTSTELITSTVVVSVTPTSRDSFQPSEAQIGGIVAGSVGLCGLLVAILIYLIRRKRKRMDFVLVSPSDTPYPGSDAEMGEVDHELWRPATQTTTPGKASTSDSDLLDRPSPGVLGYDTPRLSRSPSTLSFQQPLHRVTIDSTDDSPTVYLRSCSVDNTDYSCEECSVESDTPRKIHQGDVPFQPVPHKSPTVMSHNSVSSDFRYGYAV